MSNLPLPELTHRVACTLAACVMSLGLSVSAAPQSPTNSTGSGNTSASQPSPPSGNQTPGQPAQPAGGAAAGQGPRFTLAEGNVVRVPAATTVLTATAIPGVDKMPGADLAKYAATLDLKDVGMSRGPVVDAKVTFTTTEFIGRTGSGLTWRVGLDAAVPFGTSHTRLAAITIGNPPAVETHALEYTVSAKPAAAAQWTVRGSADVWTISWGDPPDGRVLSMTVENQDERLTNVRIAQSTLKDAAGHAVGLDRLSLVETPAGPALAGVEVPPNNAKTVFIRLENARGERFGTFDGVVRFTADGSAATKDVSLKLQASSGGRKTLGVFITLAGLLLTMFVSSRLRPQLARLQAQRAAAAVRQAIADFERELTGVLPKELQPSTMGTVARSLAESISDDRLDRDSLLPPRFAFLPGSEPPADTAAGLKTRLDTVSTRLEGLLVLLRSGVVPLLRFVETAQRDTVLRLVKEIDDLAPVITGPQDARTKADAVRAKLPQRESGALPRRDQAGEPSVRDIDIQIQSVSAAAWTIWALIALMIGTVWIASDVDYGTPLDLVGSFLWGFGMTAFGAGVQNLTPASVASQLNVKVPK